MKRILVLLVTAIPFVPLAAETRMERTLSTARIRELAEGCATTSITGCETTTAGTIGTGDCTFSDGVRYDRFDVALPAGRTVGFTLRTLAGTYTTPMLIVVPPSDEFQTPPLVSGNIAPSVWAQTFKAGTWVVAVSTEDLFATGAYVLQVDCYNETDPKRDCVLQDLLCGQTALASITAESCRFSSVPRGYGDWEIYGVAGDLLDVTVFSSDFEPVFAIYDDNYTLLQSATRASSTRATTLFSVPVAGWYHIIATSTLDNKGGDYLVEVKCSRSGCLFPYLRSPIPDVFVKHGTQATINLDLSVIGGFTAKLREDFEVLSTSSSSTLTTPPVTFSRRLIVDVENPCGSDTSNVFTVGPQNTKHRAVRK